MPMLHRLSRPLLAAAVVAALSSAASAAPLYYGTRSEFQTANPGLAVEDFEDLDGTGTTIGFSGPLNSSSDIDGVVSPGQIADGISFIDEPQGQNPDADLFLSGPGQSSQPTTAFGSNFPVEDTLNILFGPAVTAAAFDIFQNAGSGTQTGVDQDFTVSLFDELNNLISSTIITVPSSGFGFFGVLSDVAIGRINIAGTNLFEVIDDVEFGTGSGIVATVPEPSTLALLGMGLAGLGLRYRRRRTNTTV